MIFYFTGTGNSLWVAKELARVSDERLISIAEACRKGEYAYQAGTRENILFVFPVHTWGIPVLVAGFMKKLEIESYRGQPVYAVCTCGDDCGYTDKSVKMLLQRRGLEVRAVFSVAMPNNYILLPGFDVDEKTLELKKLQDAQALLAKIGEMILGKRELSAIYRPGKFAWIKSRLIYPLFVRYFLGKASFYVTDACISCGLCLKECPTRTISWKEDKPAWGNRCVQCMACIHRCPVRAIEYGKTTQKKGRYRHPDLKSGDTR